MILPEELLSAGRTAARTARFYCAPAVFAALNQHSHDECEDSPSAPHVANVLMALQSSATLKSARVVPCVLRAGLRTQRVEQAADDVAEQDRGQRKQQDHKHPDCRPAERI